jgi:hypothetical protein
MCINFNFKVGKTAEETYMLKLSFEEATINRTQTSKWFFNSKVE